MTLVERVVEVSTWMLVDVTVLVSEQAVGFDALQICFRLIRHNQIAPCNTIA